MATKRIFRFSKEACDWTEKDQGKAKKILGGKGAGLVMMAQAGMPVPPGFTITTEVCNEITKLKGPVDFLSNLLLEVEDHDKWLAEKFGYFPLVSVRSGAPVSMPGMMDTILNVGLTDASLPEWAERIGEKAALDSYRRLIQMLGSTAFGIDHDVFEFQLAKVKKEAGIAHDHELSVEQLVKLVQDFKWAFKEATGIAFPQNRYEQLQAAVGAVFNSWMNDRAVEYRKLNKIDEKMGTAVNIQAMVFGNMGDDSGTGVLFTRDPSTGAKKVMGEFLQNAQGEDVVAGIRTPENLDKMPHLDGVWPEVHGTLMVLSHTLEQHYRDMVDIEFTVQKGVLYVLQSRSGKRAAQAAFKIVVDQVAEKLIDKKTAIGRLSVDQFKIVRRPSIDPSFKVKPDLTGLPACPGVVSGKPVFSSSAAVNCSEPCILVTHETTPDDIAGMAKATGILTQTGGATSHAAVVARAMDKTCITGATAMDMDQIKKVKKLTIDGSTGKVWLDKEVPVIDGSDSAEIGTVMDWCMAVLGTSEVAPVDLGMDRPHRVMAAYWWGSQDVLNAVLDGLAELPSRQHVTLDLRGPADFQETADLPLSNCFGLGNGSDALFRTEIVKALLSRAGELTGLQIANAATDDGPLLKKGYVAAGQTVQAVPMAVPADYAAFTVLGR